MEALVNRPRKSDGTDQSDIFRGRILELTSLLTLQDQLERSQG